MRTGESGLVYRGGKGETQHSLIVYDALARVWHLATLCHLTFMSLSHFRDEEIESNEI